MEKPDRRLIVHEREKLSASLTVSLTQVAEAQQVRYAPTMDSSETEAQAQIKRLADAIYRDKVLRARAEDPLQKLLDGFELFTLGLEMTKLDVIG